MPFVIEMLKLGLANLRLHMLRSILTALGIILGVAAVIATVAIGEGSTRLALEQIERLGAKNIIVRSQKPPQSRQAQSGQQTGFVNRFGVTRADLRVIEGAFPEAEAIVPLKEVGGQVLREDRLQTSQAYGTTPDFQRVAKLRVARGRYLTEEDLRAQSLVAVIGAGVAHEFFPFDDPLGNTIRIDQTVFRIVGVLGPVGLSGGAGPALVGRDLNLDLHIPITTARAVFGDDIIRMSSGSMERNQVEISEIYISVPQREQVLDYAGLIHRLVDSRHQNQADVGMIVPYELLENARRSQLTGRIMLIAIAAISLLVGGIGIMNIMLASVTERTREIGIRRALGATRYHIVWQFLIETSTLSAIGGVIGVVLGVTGSWTIGVLVPRLPHAPFIGRYFDADAVLPTHVTAWSIALAFAVATATGLLFGIYPALRAAQQDPIQALRHD
jgi:putative ABC transport system permease protein